MSRTAVTIPTPDGSCPASLFRPAGDGPWPAVLMYMDGVGMRPALFPIAERIADAGYLVLLPDLFYRAGPYQAPDAKSLFSDPAARQAWSKTALTASAANVMRDTAAFLEYLGALADARAAKIGTTGYCMGGTVFADGRRDVPGPHRRGGVVPRRQPGHRRARQPAPAGAEDEAA